MTPEQQRIAIAKICPFVQSSPTCDYVWQSPFGGLTRFDPLNDLNAMHEAEEILKGHEQICKYVWELERITNWQPNYIVGGDGKQYLVPSSYYCTTHATATQRAEAFLRTLNLWTQP